MATESKEVFKTRLAILTVKLREERNLLQSQGNSILKPFARKLSTDISKNLLELERLGQELERGDARLPQKRFAAIERKSSVLFGECLALRLAEFTRSSVGDEICGIADKLLIELGSAANLDTPQFTTIAEAEFIGRSSRVIRLRYPATSIWDLAVLGHEFGHSVGPLWHEAEFAEPYPREAFLRLISLGSRRENDEYFCDAFATFVLGPSYPAMCILERFDPTRCDDDGEHPADTKRAWWVLRSLELIAELTEFNDDKANYIALAERLRIIWQGFSDNCDGVPLETIETTQLELALQKLIDQMGRSLPTAGYLSPAKAWGLAANFKEGMRGPVKGCSLRDLLNASWFLRIDSLAQPKQFQQIDQWARSTARNML